MRSKTSFFNATLYCKNLTRFAPLWIGYLVLLLFLLPINILAQYGSYAMVDSMDLERMVLSAALDAGHAILAVYAILLAMSVFSWQYQSRSVNTLAALPVRREGHFLASVAAAATMFLGPALITFVTGVLASAVVGEAAAGAAVLSQWLGLSILEFLFFFGLASLCAAIVGWLLPLPVLYLVLNFTAVVLNSVGISLLQTFVYGMSTRGTGATLDFLSPVYFLYASLIRTPVRGMVAGMEQTVGYRFDQWGYPAAIAVAGVAMLAAAFLLFRNRRMESAGDVIAVRRLRPVFKYCFAAGCAMVLGLLAAAVFSPQGSPTSMVMTLCLLLGGFVGYFVAEILLKKSFRVFKREWIGFGVFALCVVIAAAVVELDVFGYEKRVPAPSEVASVSIGSYGDSVELTDAAYIEEVVALHELALRDKARQETMERDWENDRTSFNVSYTLKDGGVFHRSYTVCCDETMWADTSSLPRRLSELLNAPRLVEARMGDGDVVYSLLNLYNLETHVWQEHELSLEEANEVYRTCILPDVRDGLLGRQAYYHYDDTQREEYMADLMFEVTDRESVVVYGDGSTSTATLHCGYSPTEGSRTADWIEKHTGVDLLLRSEFEDLSEHEKYGY